VRDLLFQRFRFADETLHLPIQLLAALLPELSGSDSTLTSLYSRSTRNFSSFSGGMKSSI
jgi:hypothetical protein